MFTNAARRMDVRVRLNLLLTVLAVAAIVIASGARSSGSNLVTRAVTLPSGATAYWLVHDSSTTQILAGSGRDKHRVIRWGSGGLYADTRRTYAVFGFKLNTGAPGRMYDFHTQPNDAGGWNPPCSAYVAPVAIDYKGDSRGLRIVAQPEDTGCAGTPPPGYVQGSGTFHFQVFSQAETEARRGQWVWLWAEITWGRRDLSTKGALKVWVAGESTPRVDVSGINTHWPGMNQVTYWEGAYHSSGSPGTNAVEIAATRFGRSAREAYEDVPALYAAEPAGTSGGSSTQVGSRGSGEAAIPSSLQWQGAPAPAPAPAPTPEPPPAPAPAPAPTPTPTPPPPSPTPPPPTPTPEPPAPTPEPTPAPTPAPAPAPTPEPPPAPAPTPKPTPEPAPAPVPEPEQDLQPGPRKDTAPPSQPAGLAVRNASRTQIALEWNASTDDVDVERYGVYRDGVMVTSEQKTTATVRGLTCGTAYRIEVDAEDGARNRSTKASIDASTAPCPRTTRGARPSTPDGRLPTDRVVTAKTGAARTASAPARAELGSRAAPRPSATLRARSNAVSKLSPLFSFDTFLEASPAESARLNALRTASPWLPRVDAAWLPRQTSGTGSSQLLDLISVRWDGWRFFSRGALRIHLQWSGQSFATWVAQHPGALPRLRI